jgi:hypothetical protein
MKIHDVCERYLGRVGPQVERVRGLIGAEQGLLFSVAPGPGAGAVNPSPCSMYAQGGSPGNSLKSLAATSIIRTG